jgi:DNA invertase Pin-like site-specific DNA recombinase
MKKIGYVRVSTREQCADRQIDVLEAICDQWYVEKLSAATLERPIYRSVTDRLKAGDMLVILDLDRAFRSTLDALNELQKLTQRGVHLRIIHMQLDTTTPHGEFTYTVMAACSTFERRIISLRTKEGLAAARKRGKKLGRPRKLSEQQVASARKWLKRQAVSVIAADLDVAPETLRRSLRRTDGAPCKKRKTKASARGAKRASRR